MSKLPALYSWLEKEGAPRMLVEGLKIYGVYETPGKSNNPEIMAWAKELGLDEYTADSIPWCGLFVAIVAHRAGKGVIKNPLWAGNWNMWGTPQRVAMLGDLLLFRRPGGNHVGIYVGEDSKCYHVLGGNQSDMVNIVRMEKSRCWAVRRSEFKIGQPANVRPIRLSPIGKISENEA